MCGKKVKMQTKNKAIFTRMLCRVALYHRINNTQKTKITFCIKYVSQILLLKQLRIRTCVSSRSVAVFVRVRGILQAEKKFWLFFFDPRIIIKTNPRVHNYSKKSGGRGLDQLDAMAQISSQNSLKYLLEPMQFINADNHVGFYEFLFYSRNIQYFWCEYFHP